MLPFLLLALSVSQGEELSTRRHLHVCAILENGFAMLNNGVALAADVKSDKQLHGFDVDLRSFVLRDFNYTLTAFESYGEINYRTRTGECDLGWAPFFQTPSRERCQLDERCLPLPSNVSAIQSWTPFRCCVDFTALYLPSEISILSFSDSQGSFFAAVYEAVVDSFTLNFVCFIFIWMVIFGHLIWVCERGYNVDEFPRGYMDGMEEGIWWAGVTWTTVGYGDRSPQSALGRLFSMIWMIIGITMASILTGHMVSAFAEAQANETIDRVGDLDGLRVCSYASIFAMPALPPDLDISRVVAPNIARCGELMRSGQVDAIVMETPTMSYYVRHDAWARHAGLHLSPSIETVPISVMVPEGSPFLEPINVQPPALSQQPPGVCPAVCPFFVPSPVAAAAAHELVPMLPGGSA